MATGRDIEKRAHITGFREEISKAANNSDESFFTWFNEARDKESAYIRGSWDFLIHIAQPLARYLQAPEEKSILEIGHGAGRLLAAACYCFKHATGVDIHDQNELIKKELQARAISNYELLKGDGKTVPVADSSFDVVYSFIVLQHVEKIDVFKTYLSEAYRTLRPGGLALLYFGRPCLLSLNRPSRTLYLIDRIMEYVTHTRGYKEIPARVNCTNLTVSMPYAKKVARACGFTVLQELASHKKVPDGIRLYGGQHGIALRKS